MSDQVNTIALDAAGILAAAAALCWASRPASAVIDRMTPQAWWKKQAEFVRRQHIYRARIAVEAWEQYWREIEGKE